MIWKGVFARLRVKPEEGLEVVATGKLTTYPGRSKYQIVVETMEPAGIGALMALLEERSGSWPPRDCSTRRASSCCRFCRR